MSAVLGLIETAPSDQFEVPLNVSEIGTLGAPVRLVPLPLVPVVLFALRAVHSETCGPGTVMVLRSVDRQSVENHAVNHARHVQL